MRVPMSEPDITDAERAAVLDVLSHADARARSAPRRSSSARSRRAPARATASA